MLPFKEFWYANTEVPIDEALNRSLARVHKHTQERNIGIISANRSERSAKENDTARHALSKDLRKHGYGFAHVMGRGREGDKVTDEPSILVIGAKGKRDGLKTHLKQLGRKYGQDSVLYKHHNRKVSLVRLVKLSSITCIFG